jgi:hypothetical protein
MALEAKDFQDQAQWALVAIPAPIYVLGAIPKAVTASHSAIAPLFNQIFTEIP